VTTDKPNVAWIGEIEGYECVTYSPTRTKARWKMVSAYHGHGYDSQYRLDKMEHFRGL
jgi:hypothetical protein